VVVEAGEGAGDWLEEHVIVPVVIPCGECPACRAGQGRICPGQIFPGSSVHGGFATHLSVPARGLCPVPAIRGHEQSVLAGAYGAALWGGFRTRKLADRGISFAGAGAGR
jgi:D-arabinose 1-dehydrogenase-like Zn-dependent alcohol dehydrogenase